MRIRTIKPEFYLHESLYELEVETSLPIRLAFSGLWCVADREGRFKWEPRKIGVQVLPYDKLDFSRVLHALVTRGFVVKYTVDGVDFGHIPSFSRHQVINNRERDSELPSPTECNICDASSTRDPRVATRGQSCTVEGKGMEGNREGKGMELPLAPKGESEFSDDNENGPPILEKPTYPETVTTIWEMFPAASRNRSSLAKLGRALAKLRPKPSTGHLVAAISNWQASREWQTESGKYVSGVHSWIADRKWETPPAQIAIAQKSKHAGTTAMVITGDEF